MGTLFSCPHHPPFSFLNCITDDAMDEFVPPRPPPYQPPAYHRAKSPEAEWDLVDYESSMLADRNEAAATKRAMLKRRMRPRTVSPIACRTVPHEDRRDRDHGHEDEEEIVPVDVAKRFALFRNDDSLPRAEQGLVHRLPHHFSSNKAEAEEGGGSQRQGLPFVNFASHLFPLSQTMAGQTTDNGMLFAFANA